MKVNAVQVPKGFYDETDGWHITYGDSGPGGLDEGLSDDDAR